MRRAVAGLVLAILACNALAGCFGDEDPSSEVEGGDVSGDPSIPYTEDGIFTCTDHDNLTRCWQTHVPEDLDPEVAVPLIIDMHGYASDSTIHRDLSSFDDIANEDGAIVVYPDGVSGKGMEWEMEENRTWNAGWCCAHSALDDIDDIGFIEKVVNLSIEMHNVDADRIYASGWSNGCAMAQRLAMESSQVFAAVGCMAFYLITDHVVDYAPIPVMEVHGFLDQVVLYETTAFSIPFNEEMWTNPEAYDTGAIENMYEWGTHNGCSGPVETFELNALYSIQGFDNCESNASVRLMTIYAAQHNPYSNDVDDGTALGEIFIGTQGLVESSHLVWDFMSQYSKSSETESGFLA
jgi:poly(3-hydroxybutyrate) depolymerase